MQNVLEALTRFKEIKMFGITDKFIEKFKFYNKALQDIGFSSSFRNSLPKLLFDLLVVFLIFLVSFFFGVSNYSFNEIITVLGVFLASAYRLIPSLSRLL